MTNTREKLIEKLERSLVNDGSGREMRFVGGDVTPVIANGATFAIDNNVGDKVTPTEPWISVKDMVPESHVETIDDIDGIHHIVISNFVLGCAADGQMAVVQHEVGDDKEYWIDWHGHNYDITHWMPLPSREETE